MGVVIVGVSFDPPAENHAWSVDEGFGFELWTDDRRELALYYGAADAPTDGAPDRITVVLDATGTLALEYRAGIDVGTHPRDVLGDCEVLFGGG
jgi:peroxiredoxin